MMPKRWPLMMLWLFVVLSLSAGLCSFAEPPPTDVSFGVFVEMVERGEVEEATVRRDFIRFEGAGGEVYEAAAAEEPAVVARRLEAHGVAYEVVEVVEQHWLLDVGLAIWVLMLAFSVRSLSIAQRQQQLAAEQEAEG